jgi:uracil phosphoribosyltransferase
LKRIVQPLDYTAAGPKRAPGFREFAMSDLKIIEHPLVATHLTVLRDRNTSPPLFRRSIHNLAMLLAYEATADLASEPISVQTPLQETLGRQLNQRIGLVPILRAGIGMVDPLLDLIPNSEVWHLGFYRDEATARPVHYYSKLENRSPVDVAFVLDPMLATGGSAEMACEALIRWGVQRIKMLCIIASPEGIRHLRNSCPQVEVLACVIDEGLNDQKYIVPGLGDAGDRIFNTQG